MHTQTVGSKRQVYNGTAMHTSGGLHKSDLMKHKGRIISKAKHAAGKARWEAMDVETKAKFLENCYVKKEEAS